MNIVTAYRSEKSGKNYRSPRKALLDEFHAMQKELAAACNCIAIYGNITLQFIRLKSMVDDLEAKCREYVSYEEQPKPHAEPAEADNVIPLRKAA